MPKPFDTGEKFSIIGAIALTGIVAMMYIAAAVNVNIFKIFVVELQHQSYAVVNLSFLIMLVFINLKR